MGIDDSEFTIPSGKGRIQMYHATGAKASSGSTPDQTELWSKIDNLKRYDMVLLPCEHAPNTGGKTPGYQNIVDYTATGGRAFVTHYNYTWIANRPRDSRRHRTGPPRRKYFGSDYDYPMTATSISAFRRARTLPSG